MEIRQRIIKSCQEIAKTRGFHRITVDELARCAGISKRTLYKRFSSKDEILEAAVNLFIKDVGAESDRILESEKDIREVLYKIISYLMTRGQFLINRRVLEDLNWYYPDLWQKVNAFRMERIELVVKRADKYCYKKGIDPTVLAAVFIAAVQTVVNPEFLVKNELSFEEIIEQLTRIFLPAFSSE